MSDKTHVVESELLSVVAMTSTGVNDTSLRRQREPGAGDIPMDLFRKQAPDVFPVRGVSWTNNAHEHSCLETDSYK